MSRKLTLTLLMLLIYVTPVFAWTFTYDRESPLGSSNANTIDTAIQETKKSKDERLNIDHFFAADNTSMNDATCGYHRKVTLTSDTAVAAGVASYGILHAEDVLGAAELHYMDESSNDVQLTELGGAYGTHANLTSSSRLDVAGTADFDGDVQVDGYLSIDGHLTVGDSRRISHESIARGWVRFDGTGVTINDDFGVATVGDDAQGVHTITWDRSFGNTSYVVVGTCGLTTPTVLYMSTYTAFTANTTEVRTSNVAGGAIDADIASVVAFGA